MSKSKDSSRKPPWSRVAIIASLLMIPAILIITDWSWGEVRYEVQFKAAGNCTFTASRQYQTEDPDERIKIDRQTDLESSWESRVLPLRETDTNTLHVVGTDGCTVSCVVLVNGDEHEPNKGTGEVTCEWPVRAASSSD